MTLAIADRPTTPGTMNIARPNATIAGSTREYSGTATSRDTTTAIAATCATTGMAGAAARCPTSAAAPRFATAFPLACQRKRLSRRLCAGPRRCARRRPQRSGPRLEVSLGRSRLQRPLRAARRVQAGLPGSVRSGIPTGLSGKPAQIAVGDGLCTGGAKAWSPVRCAAGA